jgi:hypothetical protein
MCTCTDSALRAAQKQREHKLYVSKRIVVDDEGNELAVADSFGFRSRFDGECDECRQTYIAGYNKATQHMYD